MTDSERRYPWPVWMGDGLLLLCILMGFTGSFLSLYGDPNPLLYRETALDLCLADESLFLVCAVLFGLATLCAWSLPRFWSVAAGGLTSLWAVCVLWNQAELAQGAGITVRDITALFASRVSWGQTFPFDTELWRAQEAAAARFFLLFVLAGLALLLGWAVVRSRRWWIVVLITLPPLLPGLAADLFPDWLPFMALAACWCAMLFSSLCRWAEPGSRGKLTLITLPAISLVLALITVLFPREGYTRPAWALKAQDDLLSFTSRLSGYFPDWSNGPFQSTVTYVGAAQEVDLAHAGPLNYTGRIVMWVNTDCDGWIFLRGSSLAVYEGGVWKALPAGTYDSYWSGQEPKVNPLYLPASLEQSGKVHTITVSNVGTVGTCVYTPYFPLPQDIDESGMLPVEDAYFARKQGQWSHTVTFVDRYPPGGGYSSVPANYTGSSVIDGNYFHYYPAGQADYAGYVYENYLDVPEELREIVGQHARSALSSLSTSYIRDPAGVYTAALYGSYLSGFCKYDAKASAPPAGVDPVAYFLTESHRGYCMHYASAVTLMLRASGIPARYVSGFKTEVVPNRQTSVPDRAAHAWVEVWVDGFGWYPVEVTPADAFDWATQPDGPEASDPVEETPAPTETPQPTETLPPTETPAPTVAPGQPSTPPGGVDGPGQGGAGPDFTALLRVLKWLSPIAAVLAAIWFVQFFVKRLRADRMSGANANRSALVCYGCLSRLERWGGAVDAQAVELAQKARFSQHTLTEEELNLLRGLVDRERARLCPAFGLPKRLLFRYWWGMPKAPRGT